MTQFNQQENLAPEMEAPAQRHRFIVWLPIVIAAIVILLDQFSKYLVETNLAVYTYWAPIPELNNFFRILHTTNTGAAFGLFASGGLFFALMAVVVSGAIIYFNRTLEGDQIWIRIALGLQMGGALGNFIDRLRQGHVTDFLDFGPWPLFNVADMAVVFGTILLAWLLLQEERAQKAAAHDAEEKVDEGPTN